VFCNAVVNSDNACASTVLACDDTDCATAREVDAC